MCACVRVYINVRVYVTGECMDMCARMCVCVLLCVRVYVQMYVCFCVSVCVCRLHSTNTVMEEDVTNCLPCHRRMYLRKKCDGKR